MKAILSLSLALLMTACCKKVQENYPNIPESNCIQQKIATFSQSSNICDSIASVKSYTFMNEWVYVFDVGNCISDKAMPVLNSNCDTLGYLGGIQGNAYINGQSFSSAVYQSTLWSN
jgi:hypothetical protein